MGLLDVIAGMQNGPRGEQQTGGGGMSPVTMALMGLLAYKAARHFSEPAASPQGGGLAAGLGGMVSRLFGGAPAGAVSEMNPGGLAALFSGGSAGAVVSSGLENLVRDLHERGYGQATQSWVGGGPNEAIAPNDLGQALGSETVDALTQQTGMNRADLLSVLSQHLPELINQLTPNGRLPTADEASRTG